MVSLRRLASLSSPGLSRPSRSSLLVRHSSLPNLFLPQTELAIGDLTHKDSSPSNASPVVREGRSVAAASKLPLLCEASIHHSSKRRHMDDAPEFEKSLEGAVHDGLSGLFWKTRGQILVSLPDSQKETISASKGLDMEKSVVYAELRECSSSWQVPLSFFRPYEREEKFQTPTSTRKPVQHHVQALSDLRVQTCSGQSDVKDPPMSLRMLKRKLSKANAQAHSDLRCEPPHKSKVLDSPSRCGAAKARFNATQAVDSVSTAFASLVYMLKLVRQYANFSSSFQQYAGVGADAGDDNSCQNRGHRAHEEMLDSFLWLFQQVFSCTPKLMLLTMMLLADFTLHSMSKHIALPLMPDGEPPTMMNKAYSTDRSAISAFAPVPGLPHLSQKGMWPSELHNHASRGGSGAFADANQHGWSFIDQNGISFLRSSMSTHVEDHVGARIPTSPECLSLVESDLLKHDFGDAEGSNLDQTTKTMFVAPVFAPVLEADNYPCFDRTDLAYQHEIGMDPCNPLFLANYAQFLHVVRHDNSRAEKFYRRAALVDRDGDGELMGRFASFLWVAKGDVVEADAAYKAAIAADPTNAYHAGSYAHFLWSSNAGQAEDSLITSCGYGSLIDSTSCPL